MKSFFGLSFAHLRGIGPRAKAAEAEPAASAEEECEDEEEMHAEQAVAEAEAEETDETGDAKKGKKSKAKKAKKKGGDETDSGDEDDTGDEDEEDEDEENGKKATSSDLRKSFARGRKLERVRGASIFGSPAAASNVELAAKLAFDGEYANLSSAAAIAILEKAGSGKGKGLSSKMQDTPKPNVGPSGTEPGKAKAIEASWEAAAKDFMPAKQ